MDRSPCRGVSAREIFLYEGAVAPSSLTTLYGVRGHPLAVSKYVLWLGEDDMLYSDCRGPWTKEQAIEHWGARKDERAVIVTKAIRELK